VLLHDLEKQKLIQPPPWLPDNVMYLTYMGSHAYGTETAESDYDIYGWCIPPKDVVFPHLAGEIAGFGKQKKRFDQYQQHHINTIDKEYDIAVYSIIRYFHLCMDNNPNMLDSLFVNRECIIHITEIGEMVRAKRKMFLHKGLFHKMKGYAYSQLHKARSKNPTGKRLALREKFGYDTKFLSHVCRLCDEAEQALTLGDINLQRANEQIKAIRRGEMSLEEVERWFATKEVQLETLYTESKLPYGPNEDEIKKLLLTCLEHCYGSLDKCVVQEDAAITAIKEMNETLRRYYARV